MIRSLESFRTPRDQLLLNEQRASARSGLLVGLSAIAMAMALQFNDHYVASYWAIALALAALAVGAIDGRRVRRLDAQLLRLAWVRFDAQLAELSNAQIEALACDQRYDAETRNRLRFNIERRLKTPVRHEEVAIARPAPVRQAEPLREAA
jgi:hypothetical protein